MIYSNKKLAKILAVIITAGALSGCGDPGKDKENTENQVTAKDTVDAVAEVEEELSYSLPSPLQIARIFKKSGLKYVEGLTSDQKDPSKYTSKFSKAINMGIYSADLAYNVINKQKQEALNYMKLSKQLADDLGMGSAFAEGNILQRFEKNLSNEDSLTYIVAELQMSTDTYLEDNEQQEISSIAFSGAWIESLYIGSKVFEKAKDAKLSSKISEQMTIVGQIITVLEKQKAKDAAIEGLVTDLSSIKAVYDKCESVKNFTPAEEGVSEVINLSDEEVKTLSKTIIEVRTKFVKG